MRIAMGGRCGRRGGIAVALVVALVILQLIVVGMVLAGARDQAMNLYRAEGLRTYYAAEAGVKMSLRELSTHVDHDGDGTIGSISADGSSATGPLLLYSRINTVLQPADSVSGTIVSEGLATQASRQVRASYSIPASGGGGGVGLAAECFAVGGSITGLSGVNWSATPTATGPVRYINFPSIADSTESFWIGGPATQYGVRLRGNIEIPQAGSWTFRLGSDAGSRLLIDGVQVVNHDGSHTYSTADGSATLSVGVHDIEVLFFEDTGSHGLTLAWQGPGVAAMTPVPPTAFSFDDAPSPEFPPIALSDSLSIWGDDTGNASYIDAFDASAGAYGDGNVLIDRLIVATNGTGSQRVQMSGRAQIRGSLQVGPGGNPASVVALWGSSQITGGSSARSRIAGIHRTIDPHVAMPASLGSQTFTSSFTINSNRTYQDFSVWGNGTAVTIVGNVVLRCTGSFNIGDQVRVELAAGATLTMYVGGSVNLYGNSRLNKNTGDPARCWIFVTGADRVVQLTDKAELVAHVRNPRGSLELWGSQGSGSELYGTFQGRSIAMGNNSRFHADISLYRSGGGGAAGSGISLTSWSLEP